MKKRNKMKKQYCIFIFLILLPLQSLVADGFTQRFPKPDFEEGYKIPETQIALARSGYWEYFDVALLTFLLSILTWLVLKKRSRNGVLLISVFTLLYFGFYREGCICPIGSIQNITAALFNADYFVSFSTILLFLIPLIFSLFFGRVFCAGACPLGAIQDLIAFKPMPLKKWVQSLLGLIPFIYLALAILYAATRSDFIICRYDPFVALFRFSGPFLMIAIGVLLLLIGMFIARPYCRFFCPYGVLLNWTSRFSQKHMSITPNACIDCKLCENSCPFGAIDKPQSFKLYEKRNVMVQRLIFYALITPLLMFAGAYTGAKLHENLALVNNKVSLAYEFMNQEGLKEAEQNLEVRTFKALGTPLETFYKNASNIVRQFYIGSIIMGAFLGLVFGLTLSRLSIPKYKKGYWPNKGTCFSCARCIDYCPVKPNSIIKK